MRKTLLISLVEQTFGRSAKICWLKFVLMSISDDEGEESQGAGESVILGYLPDHYGKLVAYGQEWIDLYAVSLALFHETPRKSNEYRSLIQ